MGTIGDFDYGSYLHDLDLEKEEREREILSRINASKSQEIADENSWEIFNYLPVNKTSLDQEEYIQHLWASFTHLNSGSEDARKFSIMPFHLVFMLSLQYKVLRIHKQQKEKYDNAFTMENPRDGEKDILNPNSVFTIAILPESKMIDLFKLVGIAPELSNRIKNIIRYRNDNLAHAKGGITLDIEVRINVYIDCLKELQKHFDILNDEVAESWLKEMGPGQEGVEYIDTHLAGDYLCPVDMQAGKLSKLDSRLNEASK